MTTHANWTTDQVRALVHQALAGSEEFLGGARMIDNLFDEWLKAVYEEGYRDGREDGRDDCF